MGRLIRQRLCRRSRRGPQGIHESSFRRSSAGEDAEAADLLDDVFGAEMSLRLPWLPDGGQDFGMVTSVNLMIEPVSPRRRRPAVPWPAVGSVDVLAASLRDPVEIASCFLPLLPVGGRAMGEEGRGD